MNSYILKDFIQISLLPKPLTNQNLAIEFTSHTRSNTMFKLFIHILFGMVVVSRMPLLHVKFGICGIFLNFTWVPTIIKIVRIAQKNLSDFKIFTKFRRYFQLIIDTCLSSIK